MSWVYEEEEVGRMKFGRRSKCRIGFKENEQEQQPFWRITLEGELYFSERILENFKCCGFKGTAAYN